MSEDSKKKLSKSKTGRSLGPMSQEQKDKISASNKGKKRGPMSEEQKAYLSGLYKGKPLNWTPKKGKENPRYGIPRPQHVVDAMVSSRVKTYQMVSPSGEYIEITNMEKFCRENSLSSGHMIAVYKGKRKQHKGYTAQIP